jgi:hypothetical protein
LSKTYSIFVFDKLKQHILKNKFNITTFLLVITFSTISYSQTTAIDSLKRVLRVAKIDTSKVTIYNNLANNFKEINPDSTTYYATKAMILSQKLHILIMVMPTSF